MWSNFNIVNLRRHRRVWVIAATQFLFQNNFDWEAGVAQNTKFLIAALTAFWTLSISASTSFILKKAGQFIVSSTINVCSNLFASVRFQIFVFFWIAEFISSVSNVNTEMWFDDWFISERVWQCSKTRRKKSIMNTKSIMLKKFRIFHVTEFADRISSKVDVWTKSMKWFATRCCVNRAGLFQSKWLGCSLGSEYSRVP